MRKRGDYAAGGYVVAGDTAFLGPFREGTETAKLGFEGLRKILDTSGEEQGEFEIIRMTGGRVLATTERAIDLMQDGEPDSAREITQGSEAQRGTERIIAAARDMEETEAHRSAEWRSEAESDFNRLIPGASNWIFVHGVPNTEYSNSLSTGGPGRPVPPGTLS